MEPTFNNFCILHFSSAVLYCLSGKWSVSWKKKIKQIVKKKKKHCKKEEEKKKFLSLRVEDSNQGGARRWQGLSENNWFGEAKIEKTEVYYDDRFQDETITGITCR